MQDRITITMLEDGIADVRLIRSDKMNALDLAMFKGLTEAIDRLKEMSGCAWSCSLAKGVPSVQG